MPSIFIIDYDYFSVCVTFDLHLLVFVFVHSVFVFFLFIIIISLFSFLVRVHICMVPVAGFVGKEHGWTTLKFLKTDNKWYYVCVFMSFFLSKSFNIHRTNWYLNKRKNRSWSPLWLSFWNSNNCYYFDFELALSYVQFLAF